MKSVYYSGRENSLTGFFIAGQVLLLCYAIVSYNV